MTYPMMGDGANDFSRSKANWDFLPSIFTIVTGDVVPQAELNRNPNKFAIDFIWSLVYSRKDIRKHDNAFCLPHAGTKWGSRFEPVHFRLDKNSRKRRFIARKKKEPKKNA